MPILQKVLGHANIRTTSGYWKGKVDIREFGEWLKPDSSPKEPEEVPKVKKDDNSSISKPPQIPPKLENPIPSKEPELLKTIAKLKGKLVQKDLIIAKKDKQLKDKDNRISLLTTENEKLRIVNQQKEQQLAEYQERLKNLGSDLNKSRQKAKELQAKNNLLLQNYTQLKNIAKNTNKNQANNNQPIEKPQPLEISPKNKAFLLTNSPNTLLKIKKPPNNSLAVKEKEQTELIAEIQVWKPPN